MPMWYPNRKHRKLDSDSSSILARRTSVVAFDSAKEEQGLVPLLGRDRLVIHDRKKLFLIPALCVVSFAFLTDALSVSFGEWFPGLAYFPPRESEESASSVVSSSLEVSFSRLPALFSKCAPLPLPTKSILPTTN